MRAAVVSVLVLVAALAAGPVVAAAPRTGVLTGQIVRDATTIQCVRAPCLEPAAGVVLTILRDGLTVARPQTDVAGRFRLSLLPGRYVIRNPRIAGDRIVQIVVGQTVRADLRLGRPAAEG